MADWGALVSEQERQLAQKVESSLRLQTSSNASASQSPQHARATGLPQPQAAGSQSLPKAADVAAASAQNSAVKALDASGAAPAEEEEKEVKKEEESLLHKLLRDRLVQPRTDIELLRSDPNSPLHSIKSFEALNLKPELLKGVYDMGFYAPSKIQETALPILLADPPVNMIAQSQSGTGKTAAFVLTMLSRLNINQHYPQCLCLAPTFELALQIGDVIQQMGKYMTGLKIRFATRGERVTRGETLNDHIVIGTPGTVMDWGVKLKVLALNKLKVFVLDEADIMISMQGHQDHSVRIQRNLNVNTCQMLLFSATYDNTVMQFAQKIIPGDPIIIRLRREEESLDNIKQYYIECSSKEEKYQALCNIYGSISIGQSMIFCHTKKTASWLAEKMTGDGHVVGLLSGELTIEQRAAIIKRFRDGKEKVLITTNVSARGIDIETVTVVVNFDLPVTIDWKPDCETYLHRIGRTGRFGKKGIAINMVDGPQSMAVMKAIEKHFGRKIEKLDSDDLDVIAKIGS